MQNLKPRKWSFVTSCTAVKTIQHIRLKAKADMRIQTLKRFTKGVKQSLSTKYFILKIVILLKYVMSGLLWWRSGWESACQCRGYGFEPWSGKIPHAAEQLGPWATITEPARLEPMLRNKRGRDSERPAHRDEEWPPLAATRESPRTETKTQHSPK